MKRTVLFIGAAAALLLASMFGGSASVEAKPRPVTPGQPIYLVGKVASSAAGKVSLNARNSTYTVNLGANTIIIVDKGGTCTNGTAADLTPEKNVTVLAAATADPMLVDAQVITENKCGPGAAARGSKGLKNNPKLNPPARGRGMPGVAAKHFSTGTIVSISNGVITVDSEMGKADKQATIVVDSNTLVLNRGFQSVNTLKAGDKVQVVQVAGMGGNSGQGTKPAGQGRTFNATVVLVLNSDTRLLSGRVDGVNGGVITLAQPGRGYDKNLAVTVDATTAYRAVSPADKALAPAAAADLAEGRHVVIEAVSTANGLVGKAVIMLPGGVGTPEPPGGVKPSRP